MSETVWVAMLTGAFTLASGVIGITLTHRFSVTQSEAARREDRRRDARALLAQFVGAGTQWASLNGTLVPVYYKAASDTQFWLEWPNTDSGTTIREHAITITRTAGELRLIVGDEKLLRLITAAQDAIADGGAMKELLEEGRRTNGGEWDGEIMANAFAYHRQVESAFRRVEARAAELLRGQL